MASRVGAVHTVGTMSAVPGSRSNDRPTRRRSRRCAWVLAATLMLGCGLGGTARAADPLDERRPVRIGVQATAVPFAFKRGKEAGFHGYSVDLCLRILQSLLGQPALTEQRDYLWVPVTSRTRLVLLLAGEVDMECGSTSRTAARQNLGVAFSSTIFVSDVAVLMAPEAAPAGRSLVDWVQDMREHQRVVVTTAGSTSVRHLRDLVGSNGAPLRKVFGSHHDDSFRLLREGKAAGFVMDRALLATRLAADTRLQNAGYKLSAWSIAPGTPECYGIMMRVLDSRLRQGVEQQLQALRASGELRRLYAKWFEEPLAEADRILQLPPDRPLGLRASAELSRVLITPGYEACR